MVVGLTIAVTTGKRSVGVVWVRTLATSAATVAAAVAHRGSDVVAVTVVVAVVVVVVVVVVVNRSGTMTRVVWMIPWIVNVIRSVPTPTPTVVEAAAVPAGTVIVGAVVISRPPPVVAQVDAQTPAGRTVVIPVQVGEEGIIVAKAKGNIGVESAETRTVAVVVVVVRIVAVVAGGTRAGRGGIVHHLHVGGDHRLAAARIVGQRAEQVAIFIGFVNDGIGLDRGGCGRCCGGIGGFNRRFAR